MRTGVLSRLASSSLRSWCAFTRSCLRAAGLKELALCRARDGLEVVPRSQSKAFFTRWVARCGMDTHGRRRLWKKTPLNSQAAAARRWLKMSCAFGVPNRPPATVSRAFYSHGILFWNDSRVLLGECFFLIVWGQGAERYFL